MEEIYVTSPQFAALFKPADGGTLAALDFRANHLTLINSLGRRPEAYHTRLRSAAAAAGAGTVASIHEQIRVKEPGLDRRLRYDRWPRHAFRLLLFSPGKTYEDYESLHLEESATFAAGAYEIVGATAERLELACQVPSDAVSVSEPINRTLRVTKIFSFSQSKQGFCIACDLELSHHSAESLRLNVGLEVVFNLLAPNEPDRYFESAGQRHPLNWSAAVPASEMRVVDEWQNVAIRVEAPRASQFWIAPVETVSESEEGFERVYQGSQILSVWPAEIAADTLWTARLVLHVSPARLTT